MSPSPPRHVLSNLLLPSPEGVSIHPFQAYVPSGKGAADPARGLLRDILPLIPAAERPDALLIASPEYLPIPPDLASFPGTRILLITDWNVCLRYLPDLCPLFDYCFTDWPGYRLLRRAGVANVFHQPLFGHDPAVFRRLGTERNLDVSFCGNLNAGLHGERNRLLARVARWSRGRPAHLRQAFGEAYVDVLNRSRLVFNHAIRGEANMRLFEAMACGAVPLVEASNQEAAILFQEGRHYFRYEPDRLEARLDELLADPARIAAVGEAARVEVARHTKAAQMRALLETAGRESARRRTESTGSGASGGPKDGSGAAQGDADGGGGGAPPLESAKAVVKLRMLGSTYTVPEAIQEILRLDGSFPGLADETLPGTLLTLIEGSSETLPAAEAMLERLFAGGRQPPAAAAFLRMRLEARRGRWEAVLAQAEACLRALADSPPAEAEGGAPETGKRLRIPYGRYYPPIHLGRGFNSDINRAYAEDAAGRGLEAYTRLLAAHCHETQARALIALGRAAEARARAEAVPPDRFASLDARGARARAAEAAGDWPRARAEWEAAFAERPLDTGAWDRLAEALMRAGDRQALIGFLEDILVLARAFLPEEQAAKVRDRLERERAAGVTPGSRP